MTYLVKIFYTLPILLVLSLKAHFADFQTRDMDVYQALFENAAPLSMGGLFTFHYDFLFYLLIRLFVSIGLTFNHFYYSYILGTVFFFLIALPHSSLKLVGRGLLSYLAFVLWLAMSSYVDESFRILPLALLSSFFLIHVLQGTRPNVFYYLLVFFHFSFIIFIALQLLQAARKTKIKKIVKALTIVLPALLLAGFYLSDRFYRIFENYRHLHERYAHDDVIIVVILTGKVLLIALFYAVHKKMVFTIFEIFLILGSLIFFSLLGLYFYTLAARSLDLIFGSFLLTLWLIQFRHKSEPVNATVKP
jgi:hypothetical protein